MTEPELWAQAVLDHLSPERDHTAWARIDTLTLLWDHGTAKVVGIRQVKVRVGSEVLDCAWLRSFAQSVAAGAAAVGDQVLLIYGGPLPVVVDLIMTEIPGAEVVQYG